MNEFFYKVIWGNTIKDWLIAAGIIAGCLLMAKLVQKIVVVRMHKAASRTASTIDDFIVSLLQRSVMPYVYILTVYAGLNYLAIDSRIFKILHVAILVTTVFFVIRSISATLAYFFQRFTSKNAKAPAQQNQAKGILLIVNIIIWIIGAIFLVDNLGYNITTIITGLGIGGIAIALAAQAILADLFSYLVIFFDKPFETGDFIIIGDKMGTVEYIGIKTTRLRALSGEQLIVSNTDLTNSRVQNYKRMEKRRVVYSIGVVYETSPDKLKSIPATIKKIVEVQPDTQFDRTHFTGFGDFSLTFEVVYYILSADYNLYMDRQQAINLAIFQAFDKAEIEFAYPTQKLLLNNMKSNTERSITKGKIFN
ncbi:MAG: mechanosensitive ion channel domain-containing protein [Chitinophagaceae bacterium]